MPIIVSLEVHVVTSMFLLDLPISDSRWTEQIWEMGPCAVNHITLQVSLLPLLISHAAGAPSGRSLSLQCSQAADPSLLEPQSIGWLFPGVKCNHQSLSAASPGSSPPRSQAGPGPNEIYGVHIRTAVLYLLSPHRMPPKAPTVFLSFLWDSLGREKYTNRLYFNVHFIWAAAFFIFRF